MPYTYGCGIVIIKALLVLTTELNVHSLLPISEYRRNKKIFNTCVCDSKVQTMRLYQDTKAGTIHGSVNVTQFPRGGQLEIILLRNSGITVGEAETWWRNGNGTYVITSIFLNFIVAL